jgi:hypothetical protein
MKRLELNRIQARFLLNFVLDESNKIHLKLRSLNSTNINNCKKGEEEYKKRMNTLVRKLQIFDRNFYK